MTDLRNKIVKVLIDTPLGLTSRELAEDFKVRVNVVSGALGQMAQSGFIMRGDYNEGEGQVWLVTDDGIKEFGGKKEIAKKEKSPLTQNEKTPVKTPKATPIAVESPLEQKLPDGWLEAVVEKISQPDKNEETNLTNPLRVNWDDAPDDAYFYQVQGIFYDNGLTKITATKLFAENRPESHRKIIVDKSYRHKAKGVEYVVKFLGEMTVNDVWVDSVTYVCDNEKVYTRPLVEFKEKFASAGA